MSASIFSPHGKNFCKFMTPNFPKPMFFGQIQLGLVGTLTYCFSKKMTSRPLAPLRGHLDLFGAHLGPVRGLLGPIWGPQSLGPGYAADGSAAAAAAAGQTLNSWPGPPPIAPRDKIHRSGDPRCDLPL